MFFVISFANIAQILDSQKYYHKQNNDLMFLNIKSIVFTENHQKKFRFGPFRVKCGSFRFNPIQSDSKPQEEMLQIEFFVSYYKSSLLVGERLTMGHVLF